jgi:ADP-ribose pyrophosphatase YjhB (NUDIX family)
LISANHSEPNSIVIIGCSNLIAEADRYLFVRESKASARARYNLPAGKPEAGETLIEAAVREAREQTGLDVVVDHLIGLYHCPRTSEEAHPRNAHRTRDRRLRERQAATAFHHRGRVGVAAYRLTPRIVQAAPSCQKQAH